MNKQTRLWRLRRVRLMAAVIAVVGLIIPATATGAGAMERLSESTVDLYEITVTVERTEPTSFITLGFDVLDDPYVPGTTGGAWGSVNAGSGLISEITFLLPFTARYQGFRYLPAPESFAAFADADVIVWEDPQSIDPIVVPEMTISFDIERLPAGFSPAADPLPFTDGDDSSDGATDDGATEEPPVLSFPDPGPSEPAPTEPPFLPEPIPEVPPTAEVLAATEAMEILLDGFDGGNDEEAAQYLAEPDVVLILIEILRQNAALLGTDGVGIGTGTQVDDSTVNLPILIVGSEIGFAQMVDNDGTWQLTTDSLCGLMGVGAPGICTGTPLQPVNDPCTYVQESPLSLFTCNPALVSV